jgi:SAM domain (Sterile alpha motif)
LCRTLLRYCSADDSEQGPRANFITLLDIVVWLRSLGLGKYEAAFRENEIIEKVLPNLTAEDLVP